MEEGTGRTLGRGNDTLVMPRRCPADAPDGVPPSPGRGNARAHLAVSALVQVTICALGPAPEDAPNQRWSACSRARRGAPDAGRRRRAWSSWRRCPALVLAGHGPAAADPSDQPGGHLGGARQPGAGRAAEARGRGADRACRRSRARWSPPGTPWPRPSRPSPTPRRSSTTPRASSPATSRSSPSYASALYRDGGGADPAHPAPLRRRPRATCCRPWASSTSSTPHAAEVIGAAETMRQAALDVQQRADGGPRRRRRRAQDEVAARVAELEAAGGRGHRRARRRAGRRGPAAGAAAEGAGRRQRRGRRPTGRPTSTSSPPPASCRPPAAQLQNPPSGLPGGLVPVAAASGGAQRGAAQLPAPAHVAARPARRDAGRGDRGDERARPARTRPGRRARTRGTAARWCSRSTAPRASLCPATQADLFAVTTPIAAADVLPGDLVFLGNGEAGLGHVGIALDPKTMLAADARAGAVVVRTLPADQVLGIGRPSLGQRAPVDGARADRRRAADGVRQHRLPAELRRRPPVGRLSQRADPAERHVPARSGRPPAALRRRGGLPGDVGGLRADVRLADLHHRLLPHLRQPGAALRRETGARRRPGHQQPRLGPGGRPLRRHRDTTAPRSTPG